MITVLFALTALAKDPQVATVGQPAPDFTLTDTAGQSVHLADYKGKTVVLEWFNPDCPFVVYAHGKDGPLASQPARQIGNGVVWLAINSNQPAAEGGDPARNVSARTEYGMTYPVLLDPNGTVGHLYGATNTPQMYVIDAKGNLAYAGALDSAPRGDLPEGATLTNYVDAALADLSAGRSVATPTAKAYGCSVKYAQ